MIVPRLLGVSSFLSEALDLFKRDGVPTVQDIKATEAHLFAQCASFLSDIKMW